MNYWIFKANPEHYRIDERLLAPEPTIIWSVTRYLERIQAGDTVFVWRASLQPGICAVMLVEANPYEPGEQELNDGFEIPTGSLVAATGQWAKCRFIKRFRTVEKSIIKKIPGLELFSFFSAFQQATNFSLTRPEGTILLEYIESHPLEAPQRKAAAILKPAVKTSSKVPARAATHTSVPSKNKPLSPATQPVEFELLKCEVCGRYVVRKDTERHVREIHAGQPVEWQKTR